MCALLRPRARIALHTQSGCKSVQGSVLLLAADPAGVEQALQHLRTTVLPVRLEDLAFRVVLAGPFDSDERVSTLRRYPFRPHKVYGAAAHYCTSYTIQVKQCFLILFLQTSFDS